MVAPAAGLCDADYGELYPPAGPVPPEKCLGSCGGAGRRGTMPVCPDRARRGTTMLFSNRIGLNDLVTFCRALRHGHEAGLTLVMIFGRQAERGPSSARPVAGRIAE